MALRYLRNKEIYVYSLKVPDLFFFARCIPAARNDMQETAKSPILVFD